MERKGFLFMSTFQMKRSLGRIGSTVGITGTLLVLSGLSSAAAAAEVLDKINLSSKIFSIGGYIRSVHVEDISRDGKVIVGRIRAPQILRRGMKDRRAVATSSWACGG